MPEVPDRIYYVVIKAGVPVDVTNIWQLAQQRAVELSTPGSDAVVIPVTPVKSPEKSD